MRGIGRAFCLKIRETRQSLRGDGATVGWWHSGTAYEYGMLPPRYPMPVLQRYAFIDAGGMRVATLHSDGWYYTNFG